VKGIERVKSPKPRNKAQRKVDYDAITMRRNYDAHLSEEINTGNYELVYYVAENVGITGVSKKYLTKYTVYI